MKYKWQSVLSVIFIIAAIVFIVLALLFARPVVTTNQNLKSTLQTNFDAGDGHIEVNRSVVPFQVSAPQLFVAISAATFTTQNNAVSIVNDVVIANLFQVRGGFARVVSLQIVAGFNKPDEKDSTSRSVGIFNLDTQRLLIQQQVSAFDALDNGFYTLRLDNNTSNPPVVLEPFVNYAVCALLSGGHDLAFPDTDDTVQPGLRIELLGRFEFKTSTFPVQLPAPVQFTKRTNNLAFASFQVQPFQTGATIAFDVDVVNGYGRFPAEYLYNLNVSAQSSTLVAIDAGLCINNLNGFNMVSSTPLIVNSEQLATPNGLDGGMISADRWYAVFLIVSSAQGLPPAGLLSMNRQQPTIMPIGYDLARRVGWVRTDQNAHFILTTQTGNGARRRTFFVDEQVVFQRTYSRLEIANVTYFHLPLDIIAPLATSVLLNFYGVNPNAKSVSVVLKKPNSTELLPQGRLEHGQSRIQSTIPVQTIPLPYYFSVALAAPFLDDEQSVELTVSVQAFYDKV